MLDERGRAHGLRVHLGRMPALRFVYIRVHDPYANQRLVTSYRALLVYYDPLVTEIENYASSLADRIELESS